MSSCVWNITRIQLSFLLFFWSLFNAFRIILQFSFLYFTQFMSSFYFIFLLLLFVPQFFHSGSEWEKNTFHSNLRFERIFFVRNVRSVFVGFLNIYRTDWRCWAMRLLEMFEIIFFHQFWLRKFQNNSIQMNSKLFFTGIY